MPIYAYRCDACGFRKDVLQKMSDPALTICPSCGAESFAKQLSAPAFQLKGTGWYATDFRDKGAKPGGAEAAEASGGEAAAGAANGTDKAATAKPADGKVNGKGASADAAAAPAAPAAAKPEVKGGGSGASAGTPSGGSSAS